ncbi:hypothetical protein EDD29_7297 [Actinocorallia herbida]|uniref:Uncharacterized protein n=1 Tax=Actinocorallia herbida TaxID=58109 RepID=A0A3N1D7X3_9ACTN|nr:hypothetical protein [Actinocorallia herbida]ROO89596.1 hypothetical protein EDD29_7297 [Actinocorallia herbida]
MPTLARGQSAYMCFGVAKDEDADYGLSDAQQEAEARPQMWGNKQPGMAYLDAPGIPETHIAMPLRTYSWGTTPREATAAMREHAAAWPARAKDTDEFTARLTAFPDETSPAFLPRPAEPDEAVDELSEHVRDNADDLAELLAQAAELVITTRHAGSAGLSRELRVDHAIAVRGVLDEDKEGSTTLYTDTDTDPLRPLVSAWSAMKPGPPRGGPGFLSPRQTPRVPAGSWR